MSLFYTEGNGSEIKGVNVGIAIVLGCIVIIAVLMAIIPKYRVYSRTLHGEAQLREQEYSKQILVEQAKAEAEAAKLLAEAEVTRARGVAQANEIIAGGLKNNPDYLQYLAIQAQEKMADNPNHSVIYIPSGFNGIPLVKTIE